MNSGIELLKTECGLYKFQIWHENRIIAISNVWEDVNKCLAYIMECRKEVKSNAIPSGKENPYLWFADLAIFLHTYAMSKEDVERNIVLVKRFMPTMSLTDSTGESEITQPTICANCIHKIDTINEVKINHIVCKSCKSDWANKDTMKLNFETLRRFDCPIKE